VVRHDPKDLVAKNNLAVVSFLHSRMMFGRGNTLDDSRVYERRRLDSLRRAPLPARGKTAEALASRASTRAALEEPGNAACGLVLLAAGGEGKGAEKYFVALAGARVGSALFEGEREAH
jgi:hypothetical protein